MADDPKPDKQYLRRQLAPIMDMLAKATQDDFKVGSKLAEGSPEFAELHSAIQTLVSDMQLKTTELAAIIESSPQFIVEIDNKFRIVFINRTVPGVKKEDVIGKNVLDFLGVADRSRIEDLYERVLKSGKPEVMEFESLGANNTKSWYRGNVGPVKGPKGVDRLVVVSEDISDERAVLDQLKSRTAELEKFNQLMVGRELKMIELKERIAQLEGQSPDKAPGGG